MARMYPTQLEISNDVSAAEYVLYHQLRDRLDNSYVVFHSVAWQALGPAGRPQDGETDFIIAHPNDGILVLEVKGGAVRYSPARNEWLSVSQGEQTYAIKDPFVQARNAKYTLLALLQKMLPRVRDLTLGHAVAFPDVLLDDTQMGPDKPAAIILDMAGMADLAGWVSEALAYWRGAAAPADITQGRQVMTTLLNLLGKTHELRPAMWGQIVREQTEMIRLTEEQYVILDALNRQRRAAIAGCAGSGKTMLAVEKAVRLANQGFNVLLTCYNKYLVRFLQDHVGQHANLDIRNFHRLCFDLAREAQLLPIQTDDAHDFYGYRLPQAMMEAADKLNVRYDAIIVDEGQDFEEAWWIPLQTLLRDPDNGILYIFYDDNQQIYGKKRIAREAQALIPLDSTFPIQTPPYVLTVNCRNTRTIHKQVQRFYRAEAETVARGPYGRPVDVKRYATPSQLHAALTDTLRRLTRDEQIPPHEITILTPLARGKSELWLSDGFRGIRYTDKWPAAPEQVHCNTIHGFKGLESSVVILAEIDRLSPRAQELDPLLYVACSRARSHLVVLLPESAPPVLQRRFA